MISNMYSQQQMAPMPQQQKSTIQKVNSISMISFSSSFLLLQLLDDNSHLISLILDLQSKGRQMECLE